MSDDRASGRRTIDAGAVQVMLAEGCRRCAVPGAQLGLLRGAERLVAVAGTLGVESSEPVAAATAFHAGSIAKSLAALTVVDAAGRGEIDLDVACAEQADGLWPDTPRALMAHITGRPNELPGVDEDLRAFIDRVGAMPLVHRPGVFSYGNAGWSVLDALLQARAGAGFEQLAAERVLRRPLHFGAPPRAATGHVAPPSGPPQAVPGMYAAAASAAGSRWWTTADELLDYALLHLHPGVSAPHLAVADVELLQQRHAPLPGATVADAWGLGWCLWDRPDHRAFGWAGFTGGHRAYLRCFPDQDAAVVLLTNSAGSLFGPPGGSALFDELLPATLELLGVPDLVEPVRPATGQRADALAGAYGPLRVDAAGDDGLLVHADAFGEPAPIRHRRVGGDTFHAEAPRPGSTPLAFENDLLYLGPMAFPRTG